MLLGILFATLAQVQALAQAASPYPEALRQAGFADGEYTCLLTWEERASNGTWITGFRVQASNATTAFDVYLSDAGHLLDEVALRRDGIGARPWGVAASRPTEFVWDANRASAPAPQPHGPAAKSVAPVLQVTAPDLEMARAEDRNAAKDLRRTGLIQDLPVPVRMEVGAASAGAWSTLPNGDRLWQLTIWSPDARGLRVRLRDLDLPGGINALAYAPADPDHAHVLPATEAEYWTPTTFGDEVTLECLVPQGSLPPSFVVDALVYQYEDLLALVEEKIAGSCNLDVSCYSAYAQTALGVGGLGVVTSGGSLFCTGALLADADPSTAIPYLLTADHCVSTQSKASTVEVYWFFQNSGCANPATPPSAGSVPRTTGGAELLAHSSVSGGNDFSLMQLRNAPPNGVSFLGFATTPPETGAEVACIHHPRGEYKRISFGTKVITGSPSSSGQALQPRARFHEILWHDGTTEPGSSGSPLFLASSRQLIGQLWGGRAACSKPTEPDYYGRFDVTYPVVSRWLGVPAVHPYDVDGSGTLDAVDVQLVVNAALGRPVAVDADLNASGRVDAVDLQLIVQALLSGA